MTLRDIKLGGQEIIGIGSLRILTADVGEQPYLYHKTADYPPVK